ncbi:MULTISPECIES: isocitrate/isopropylmalate dehydrogenase family protein [Candidatus Nitrosocaldus]|jgi:3-isopropylmalate dehydrogenase|uniref:3-isopropylmalate dehydrogenase n=1 Tax=Candidatus Nitrosocaldus cavascurensis TaxID=2058097 RepID=A0A2K5ARY3_9ARCH|nr:MULTISPECIES: isocitrate/isopropylmalate dehydrogenase family protein [Candidatus Nitrosocaldus]SPC34400.1 3-isopropylmalate dehydrogenase [Candidatus Nitrosocaldus cavascurensis]
MYRIAFIEGDGIGPEISRATRVVLDALNARLGIKMRIIDVEAGDSALARYGRALPEHSLDTIRGSDACIKAPIGESAADVIVYLRRVLDLYANVRPAKAYPGMRGLRDGIDLIIVRENTEDIYSGLEYDIGSDASIAIKVTTKRACMRIAEYAFKLAEARDGKRSVVAVHKANLLRRTDGLFARCCREVASRHQSIRFSEMYVDACAMNLIRNPEAFDVIVTMNMYGDILSDEAAQVAGSLGMAPSANIGDTYAIFEPAHGSAPDIAGKGIANPLSLILSAGMMYEWLASKHNDARCAEASKLVEVSIRSVLSKGIATPDLGGRSSTEEVADAIVEEIKRG